MTTNSSDYPNIRTSVPKKIGSAHEESIVIDREFFDCVNINGPVDNSGLPNLKYQGATLMMITTVTLCSIRRL